MFIIKLIYIIIAILTGSFHILGSITCLVNNIKTNKKLHIPTDFGNDILPYLFFAFTGLLMIFLPLVTI